jgi:hypothetical protein
MKTIRTALIILLVSFSAYMITSCSSGESSLPGTWITESVTVDVDSTLANMASIDQSIVTSKTTKFTLNEDHTMALSIGGYDTDAFWSFDSETDIVSFRLDDKEVGEAIELGKLDGGDIVYTSAVKHGTITAIYVKE